MSVDYNLPVYPPVADQRLVMLTRSFEQLVRQVPDSWSPRQRILSEKKNGYLFVEIRSSFRIKLNEGEI